MLIVELRNFGPVEKLLFWSGQLVEGLEFRPGIALIYGKHGCGKTLLALALHVLPLEVVRRIDESSSVRKAVTGYIDVLNNFIDIEDLVANSTAGFCRPGIEVEELESIGWSPSHIKWACVRFFKGDVKLHLVSVDGKVVLSENVKELGSRGRNAIESILAQSLAVISVPFNLLAKLYTLSYSEFKHLQNAFSELDSCSEPLCEILKLRIIPIVVDYEGITESTHKGLGRLGVVFKGYRGVESIKIFMKKSLGEVKEEIMDTVKELLNLMKSQLKEYRATPTVLIDDMFDGFTSREVVADVLKRLKSIVNTFNASVYTTTHRSVAALVKEDTGIESKILVASYGLQKTSQRLGVQTDFRLVLADTEAIEGIGKDLKDEIGGEFIG
jgi:hypothetical protein